MPIPLPAGDFLLLVVPDFVGHPDSLPLPAASLEYGAIVRMNGENEKARLFPVVRASFPRILAGLSTDSHLILTGYRELLRRAENRTQDRRVVSVGSTNTSLPAQRETSSANFPSKWAEATRVPEATA